MDRGSQQDKPGAIHVRSLLILKVLLSILVVLAVVIAGCLFVPSSQAVRRAAFPALAGAALVLALLGVVLMVVAARTQVRRMLKFFLILTGASAAGVLLCALLHNIVYGLLIHCFGDDAWHRHRFVKFAFDISIYRLKA